MRKFTALILGLLFLAATIAGYAFVHARISGFVATIAKAKETAFSTDARDQALRRADALITETAAGRAELETFVVPDSDSVRLIDAVEAAAKREGVTVTIGSVAVLPASWTYHEPVRVTLSARGSLSALSRFASALETLPEASRLVTASFEASADRQWFATIVIDFIKEKSPAL